MNKAQLAIYQLLVLFVQFLVVVLNITVSFPYELLGRLKKSRRCPPIKNDILLVSATKLADKIRKGEVTSKQVVTAYISRVKEVNTVLNAVIEDRFKEALEDADKADDIIRSKQYTEEELKLKFPILGLPVTVKNSIKVKDMLFLGGRKFKNQESRRATNDSDVIRQVKEAGGIVLLTSSCPELCISFDCSNKVIGTTCNPYDTRRTTGGSSGGEAALLSSGASILGVGSDIAGSCRLPAAFCGVFGHKPTYESVSVQGHYPSSTDEKRWQKLFILGPMVRYAEDFHLLFPILSKPQKHLALQMDKLVDFTKLKVYYMDDNGGSALTHAVCDEIKAAVGKVIRHLGNITSHKPERVQIDSLKNSSLIMCIKGLEVDNVEDVFDKDPNKSAYLEALKCAIGRSHYNYPSIFYIICKQLSGYFPMDQLEAKNLSALERSFESILKDEAVFIYPTTPNTAFFHGQMVPNALDFSYTGIFNVLGLPATNCPVGLSSQGLPIGVQVVANVNCDYLTLAVAREIENKLGGWIPPPFKT